ncbi:MAG TPA: hypothetical protein VHE81_12690 [Lacipirellulaceae bacterium]|nr:hypothetical protein [Lacipirellulaceae bacterium]
MTSVVLGAIGLMLFFLPVIGIPISVSGAAIGLIGIVVAYFGGSASLRLCVAGIVLSGCAVGINWAIRGAAGGYYWPRQTFPSLPPATERPYVPPPAEPRISFNQSRASSASMI